MVPHYGSVFLLLIISVINCSTSEIDNNSLNCDQIVSIGTKYCDWFYASEFDSLKSYILDSNYKLVELKEFRIKVETSLGKKGKVLNEQFGVEPWQHYFIRYNRFDKSHQPVRTLFTFDARGRIIQYSVQTLPKEATSRFLNYTIKTKLSLPFEGQWFVAWGGRAINQNQHVVSSEQQFAYDFVIRKDCRTFAGDGKSNENYFCYEHKVLSPGAGKIVEIKKDVIENEIGQVPPVHGNRIVIDHENGEYSVISHFKKGSFVVRVNDRVERGQLLGLCGNSGQSTEPHIHYHLQNTSDINNGEGLPIKFFEYISNKYLVKCGEPIIGEFVQNSINR